AGSTWLHLRNHFPDDYSHFLWEACPDNLSLLQGIFPTQKLNQGLLHCRRILYQLSYQGKELGVVLRVPLMKRVVDACTPIPTNSKEATKSRKQSSVFQQSIFYVCESFCFEDNPLILEAQEDKWVTPCSLVNRQTGSPYPIQEDHGLGTLQCRVEGIYIGSQNVSFSVFNKGKSVIHKDAWLVSAKQDLFLYQTYSEILSVFPETGSLGGRTDITITGDFFDNPAQVTIAGIPCDIRHVSPRRIECTTRAPGKGARLSAPQAGNRGLLFEVGDASEDLDLTEATPGYSWQIVPNASSPSGFWSKEGQPFRARLSGFFVAPETNNYTFWIQADNQASLYFSWLEDLRTKVKVASIRVGTADWFDSWEQNGSDETQQQKTPKLELLGGARYYLEAEHQGRAPSSGVRIGVQIHNTWLNPDVVSTYLREKHQIRAWAQRLPEIQMLTVSGTGNFFLTWDNISSQPIPANATAHQIQTAIEELLAVKCKLEPLSANILLWLGFEQGLEVSSSDGHLTSGTEPFCGRFSLHQPRHLVLTPPTAQKVYRLDQYTHLCLAYRGHENTTLKMTVSFTVGLRNPVKNITCDWSLLGTSPSWQFTCTDLWKTCVHHSSHLQLPPANSPVLVHQIDLLPLSPEMGMFYVDEIIIADTNLTVSQADTGTARPGGNLLELLSVVGSPPVYKVTSWLAGCGLELPLITASAVPTEGAEEGSGLVQVATQRLQRTSPPLGGHFRIQLSNTAIPGVPVHISASHLQKLLQTSADDFTSKYLNVSDFTVTEDLKSCYEHVWTLSWSSQVGDLPNFIKVSNENLTGVNPAVTTRVVYDGGVFLGPIFGDMLATANQYTQVVVRVNDIPAYCSGSCAFRYLDGSTPQVHSVWYALDDIYLLVYITGTSFSGDYEALQVTVNKTSCKVIFSNQTNVVCQTSLLPVGLHRISMLVRPSGLAINASGGGLFLNVEPRLDSVEPSRAADIGGLWATIRGSGLDNVNLVLFGSQSCVINVTTSNSRRIQCKVPSKGEDGPTVNVTVILGDRSVVLAMAFTYVSSLNPVIMSLSRNGSSIAGGEILSIGMVLPVNHTDLDAEVYIGDTRAWVQAQTAQGLEVVLPPLPAGLHGISVSINGVHIHAQGVDLHIQYITEVFSIQPCCGSILGGTILSISGRGFSRDRTLLWVLVGNRSCDIVNSTETNVWCETPPPAALPLSAPPSPHRPSPRLVGKGFTFTYEVAATPVVTATRGEVTNHSLRLYVEGQNLSDSVVLLGNLSCDLQTPSPGSNLSLAGCAFPLDTLEAGLYPLQIHQRQMGFADMSAVPQQCVVTPQITAIFPTRGSTCGGTVLTVRGLALHSSRGSLEVDLSGPFTCVILSLGDQTVLCQITPVGDPLPGASFTLNVTVLVNGLPSTCQGNCTLFLSEETTSIVDAWTTNINGSLTTVLIKGQRLGITADEPVVFVDDCLACTVTFHNRSHVACWISDLSPGLHYLSVFHTRYGYACSGNFSRHFHVLPQVFHYFPKNFSLHGGSLLTLEGTALKGLNSTLVYIGQQACLTVSLSSELIQCAVPAGNGSASLDIEVDGLSYKMGVIGYSSAFTPELLSVSQTDDVLTFSVARISGATNVDIFVGMFPCVGVSGNHTLLHCVVPSLPAGEYQVRGYDRMRGWASSVLVFTSRVTIAAVTENFGHLGGRLVHVFGAGFSPGNISAAVCGAPCQVLANATVSAFSCLVLPLDVSLASLCDLRPEEEDCETSSCSYVHCDLIITVGTESLPESWPYFYICEESSRCLLAQDHWTEPILPSFSGLFISPKVERDEVLIYNSSCTITMETEAKMECETPNQPITAKITEIRKSRGQNTQGHRSCKCRSDEGFAILNCTSWVREAWFSLISGLVLKIHAMISNVVFLLLCTPVPLLSSWLAVMSQRFTVVSEDAELVSKCRERTDSSVRATVNSSYTQSTFSVGCFWRTIISRSIHVAVNDIISFLFMRNHSRINLMQSQGAWQAIVHGVATSQTQLRSWHPVPSLHGEYESRSVVSDSLQPSGLYSPWNSPGQNTGKYLYFKILFNAWIAVKKSKAPLLNLTPSFFTSVHVHVSPCPETPSHLPPHSNSLGCPNALALNALFHVLNLDWSSISHVLIIIPLCICTTTFLSANGHLGCFHVLAIVNSAVMNIGVHVSFSILVSLVHHVLQCCCKLQKCGRICGFFPHNSTCAGSCLFPPESHSGTLFLCSLMKWLFPCLCSAFCGARFNLQLPSLYLVTFQRVGLILQVNKMAKKSSGWKNHHLEIPGGLTYMLGIMKSSDMLKGGSFTLSNLLFPGLFCLRESDLFLPSMKYPLATSTEIIRKGKVRVFHTCPLLPLVHNEMSGEMGIHECLLHASNGTGSGKKPHSAEWHEIWPQFRSSSFILFVSGPTAGKWQSRDSRTEEFQSLFFCFLYPPPLTVISLDMLLCGLVFVYAGGGLIFIFYNYHRNKVGCHLLLQEIFLTQGSNSHILCLLHCKQILHLLSHQGSPPERNQVSKLSLKAFPAPPPHNLQAGERWPLLISVSAGIECASMVLYLVFHTEYKCCEKDDYVHGWISEMLVPFGSLSLYSFLPPPLSCSLPLFSFFLTISFTCPPLKKINIGLELIAASTEFYFMITESLIGLFSLEGHFSEGKEKRGELSFFFFFYYSATQLLQPLCQCGFHCCMEVVVGCNMAQVPHVWTQLSEPWCSAQYVMNNVQLVFTVIAIFQISLICSLCCLWKREDFFFLMAHSFVIAPHSQTCPYNPGYCRAKSFINACVFSINTPLGPSKIFPVGVMGGAVLEAVSSCSVKFQMSKLINSDFSQRQLVRSCANLTSSNKRRRKMTI
ncbi:hypothetical protein FD754_009495, partial [Muntiacus muntjak]